MASDFAYKRILCPVDFSETSRKALIRAVAYSRTYDAPLTMLHVRDEAEEEEIERAGGNMTATQRLELGLIKRLDDMQSEGALTDEERSRITLAIRHGKPWLEIVRFAITESIDLIIMGTHGRTGFRHMFMGSECERVVRRAPCDVLAVKPDGYDPKIEID